MYTEKDGAWLTQHELYSEDKSRRAPFPGAAFRLQTGPLFSVIVSGLGILDRTQISSGCTE